MSAAPRLGRPIRLAFGLALGAYLSLAAWLVWRTSILEPYSDMYDWIARYQRLQADGDVGRYLWAPHNLHHLVWTFSILDLDIDAFGASSYLFLAVGVACLAATAGLMAALAAAAAGPGLRLVGAGVAAALGLMGCHVLDANADIETTYLHALVFAVAAIVLAQAPARRRFAARAGALACAVAAGLGSAAGLAVWPAMLFVAWREGRRGWAVAVLATGAAFGLIYLGGEAGSGMAVAGPPGIARLSDAARLMLDYLGLPWTRGVHVGGVVGLAVLAMALVAVARRGGRDASWPERAAVALILFSLTTALMAGAARTTPGAPQIAPMRYAVFLIPLHVGLWILALPYLKRALLRWPRRAEAAILAAAALMLVHQGVMAVFAVRTADANLRVVADFRAGKRTPEMGTAIYVDLAQAQILSDRLRREGRYQRELRPDPPPVNGSGISASSTGR